MKSENKILVATKNVFQFRNQSSWQMTGSTTIGIKFLWLLWYKYHYIIAVWVALSNKVSTHRFQFSWTKPLFNGWWNDWQRVQHFSLYKVLPYWHILFFTTHVQQSTQTVDIQNEKIFNIIENFCLIVWTSGLPRTSKAHFGSIIQEIKKINEIKGHQIQHKARQGYEQGDKYSSPFSYPWWKISSMKF